MVGAVMQLCALLMMCSLVLVFLHNRQKSEDISSVKITLSKVDGNAILLFNETMRVKFFDENERFDSLNVVNDAPLSSLVWEFPFAQSHVLGTFASPQDIASSNDLRVHLYSNRTNAQLGTFNLSSVIAANFPNTSQVLWADRTVKVSCFSEDMSIQATFWVNYEGVVDVFGVTCPTWKLIAVIAGVKLGACLLLAFLDWCCLPLHRASSWEKCKILFGNTIWLLCGGLSTGNVIMTIVLFPFESKQARSRVFTTFPFGRVNQQDEPLWQRNSVYDGSGSTGRLSRAAFVPI
eukprot:TRINITY_DN362_c0_g1_i2.p1 TRINITY_DN362_c0_g1~~TRINITY_DN362_c0_g1_i2.p1  ORF type:complete len:292 (-),score=62.13 TRINITY_DN362_c0_g1_i2:31-906(-)